MSSRRKHPKRPLQPKQTGAFQVGPGMLVGVEFAVTDEDGQAVLLAESRLQFVHGYGEVLPRIEAALDASVAGDRRSAKLSPSDAFGAWDPARVIEVEREEFPADVGVGDSYEFENEDGKILVMRVLEVTEEVVVLDSNHPLAGQGLLYELTVTSVEPASEARLRDAERRALVGSESGVGSEPALISPAHLVRSLRPGAVSAEPTPSTSAATASDDGCVGGNGAEQ